MAYRCKVWKKQEDGSVVNQIVDSDDIPEGWTPDPAKLEEAPKKRRKRKVKPDGDN